MGKAKIPTTPGLRQLRGLGIAFTPHLYAYQEHGGTRVAAEQLGVDEHLVVKTLVMEDQDKRPLLVLMHGDQEVSTKKLARVLGVKGVRPCSPQVALKHTGYQVGGISPLGTRRKLPLYVQESILELERIFVNAGKRGFLVEVDPAELARALEAVPVEAAR